MRLKQLIEQPCGLKYMIDNLDTHSGFARRMILDTEMPTDVRIINANYQILKQFYDVVNNQENQNQINNMQFKLCNLKEIGGTITHLRNKYVLDDIELFEVKHLAMLAGEVQIVMNNLQLGESIFIPNLEEVVSILDPDGMKIASFYIYDSYSPRLMELRRIMKAKEDFDEALFSEMTSIEDEVRAKLSMQLSKFADELEAAQKALAFIDLNLAKAYQMIKYDLCFPTISEDGTTEYEWLFNPEVKDALEQRNRTFQPVDITFWNKPTLITGANMGGKTVVLKTLTLCQYLFQFGFGIPATKAKIDLKDEIYFCIGDEQSIEKGLSSFAAEMKNIDAVIKASRGKRKLLALIDEPARTTNPKEGTALVSALVKVLEVENVSLVMTTHYDIEPTDSRRLRVKGFENGTMNYELVEVKDGEVPHEALNIAESLGIDKEWIEKARGILIMSNSTQLNISNSIGLDLKWSNTTTLGKEKGGKA